jgi:hypothetical protein
MLLAFGPTKATLTPGAMSALPTIDTRVISLSVTLGFFVSADA